MASDSSNWVAAGSIAPASNTSTGVVDTDAICITSDADEQFMFVQNNCTEVRTDGPRVTAHGLNHGCPGSAHQRAVLIAAQCSWSDAAQ